MVIQSERVWMAGQFVPLQLEIQSGVIQAVLPYGEKEADEDYGSYRIVPGFIDVHTHGAYGFDTNDGEPEGLRNWIKRVPEEGVTSLLPTTVTQMPDVLTAALKNVAEVMEDVEKDSFYFMNSDGGMTLSGGETCLQPEFARALIEAAHRRYIPVALETAGAVRWESLWKVAELADEILFDLKTTKTEHFAQVGNIF